MADPLSALRAALDEFYAGEAGTCLQRLRDPRDDGAPATRSRGHWLASEAARDAFAEARERSELDATETEWLGRQLEAVRYALPVLAADMTTRALLARATRESGEKLELSALCAQLARADDERRRASEAQALETVLMPIALRAAAAYARAEQPLLVARELPKTLSSPPPAGRASGLLIVSSYSVEALTPAARELPAEPWLDRARAFLAQTDAAAEDAVRHSLRALRAPRVPDWYLLLRGLRAPELDSETAARTRWRRAAGWLSLLGFDRELQTRVRTEPARGAELPFAQVCAPRVPHDVRVAQSAINFGVASDVFAAEGVGRALGLALAHPALPAELRWPCGANVAGALGTLSLQLFGERAHLERVHGMSAGEAERVGRVAGTLALLWTRAACAVAVCELAHEDRAESRLEALAAALSRALCCEVAPAIAGLLGADRVLARARAQEALCGLALHVALRDSFDADFYRNPRVGELLRSVAARGNNLRLEALCTELGTSLAAAPPRGLELVS